MRQEYIILIVIVVIIIICKSSWCEKYEEITINGTLYKVNSTFPKESAKVLDKLNEHAIGVITLLRRRCEKLKPENVMTDNEIIMLRLYNRLRQKYNPDVLYEHVKKYYKNATSFSYNKGEKLVMCIRDSNGKLHEDYITIMVLIHELSHIGGADWQHGEPFWRRYEIMCDLVAQANWFKDVVLPTKKICYCGKINIPPSEFDKIIYPTNMV